MASKRRRKGGILSLPNTRVRTVDSHILCERNGRLRGGKV